MSWQDFKFGDLVVIQKGALIYNEATNKEEFCFENKICFYIKEMKFIPTLIDHKLFNGNILYIPSGYSSFIKKALI